MVCGEKGEIFWVDSETDFAVRVLPIRGSFVFKPGVVFSSV